MNKASKNPPDDFSYKPFKHLNDIIRDKGIQLSEEKTKISDNGLSDEELFASEMSKVREIKEFRRLAIKNKQPFHKPTKTDSDREVINALSNIVSGRGGFSLRDTQEYVEWLNPKYAAFYRKDTAKKLHEGAYSVQDYLDMHGMTLDDADVIVDNFLNESMIKGLRCVKFIHGRGLRSPSGAAILKDALIKWLMGRYHKHIIAFATAPHYNGGLGALHVLLMRRNTR